MDKNIPDFESIASAILDEGEKQREEIRFAFHMFNAGLQAMIDFYDRKLDLRDEKVIGGLVMKALGEWKNDASK